MTTLHFWMQNLTTIYEMCMLKSILPVQAAESDGFYKNALIFHWHYHYQIKNQPLRMFFTMVGMPNVIMCLVFLPVYPIYASSY
jgi:hypothetical protein